MTTSHKKISVVAVLCVVAVLVTVAITTKPAESMPQTANPVIKTSPPPTPPVELPIATYHYVEYVTDERDTIRKSLAIQPHTFEQHLKTIEENSYQTVFVKEIPNILNGTTKLDKKLIALTFDDGYRDFYTDVFPLLKKYNAKATIYIVWVFIGQPNYMYQWQIQEVLDSGLVELGSHGVGHMNLPLIEKEIAFEQIRESKHLLSNMFGVEVETFAYPYGGFNQELKNYVENVGYKAAVSIDDGTTQTQDRLFSLHRIKAGGLLYELQQ